MTAIADVLSAVFPVLAIVGLGLFLRRLRVLNREADQSILRLTINVLIPCLIWDSILGNPALDNPANAWRPPLFGFFGVVLGFGLAWMACGLAGLRQAAEKRAFTLTTGLYNWAYLALPLCVILFGRETVGVLFVHNLGVEVAVWTVGFMILTGQSLRAGWKRLINGPVIAIITAILFHFAGGDEWIPVFFRRGIEMLGASAIPVGLLLVGATFWDHLGHARLFKHSRTGVVAVLLRLLIIPVIFLLAAATVPMSIELKRVLIIQAAMPSAVFPVILARHYGGDVPTALRVVLWTALVGIVTMPLWILVGLRMLE